jgi:hypothetical protein
MFDLPLIQCTVPKLIIDAFLNFSVGNQALCPLHDTSAPGRVLIPVNVDGLCSRYMKLCVFFLSGSMVLQ